MLENTNKDLYANFEYIIKSINIDDIHFLKIKFQLLCAAKDKDSNIKEYLLLKDRKNRTLLHHLTLRYSDDDITDEEARILAEIINNTMLYHPDPLAYLTYYDCYDKSPFHYTIHNYTALLDPIRTICNKRYKHNRSILHIVSIEYSNNKETGDQFLNDVSPIFSLYPNPMDYINLKDDKGLTPFQYSIQSGKIITEPIEIIFNFIRKRINDKRLSYSTLLESLNNNPFTLIHLAYVYNIKKGVADKLIDECLNYPGEFIKYMRGIQKECGYNSFLGIFLACHIKDTKYIINMLIKDAKSLFAEYAQSNLNQSTLLIQKEYIEKSLKTFFHSYSCMIDGYGFGNILHMAMYMNHVPGNKIKKLLSILEQKLGIDFVIDYLSSKTSEDYNLLHIAMKDIDKIQLLTGYIKSIMEQLRKERTNNTGSISKIEHFIQKNIIKKKDELMNIYCSHNKEHYAMALYLIEQLEQLVEEKIQYKKLYFSKPNFRDSENKKNKSCTKVLS